MDKYDSDPQTWIEPFKWDYLFFLKNQNNRWTATYLKTFKNLLLFLAKNIAENNLNIFCF